MDCANSGARWTGAPRLYEIFRISFRNKLGIPTPDFLVCYGTEQKTLKHSFTFLVKQAV